MDSSIAPLCILAISRGLPLKPESLADQTEGTTTMRQWGLGITALAVIAFACISLGTLSAVLMAIVKLSVVYFIITGVGKLAVAYANRLPY